MYSMQPRAPPPRYQFSAQSSSQTSLSDLLTKVGKQFDTTVLLKMTESFQSKSFALLCMSKPMIRPNNPRMAAKISIVRILTNLGLSVRVVEHRSGSAYSDGSAASARAALLPLMPTQTPQIRLHMPTVRPAQNNAYPVKMLEGE